MCDCVWDNWSEPFNSVEHRSFGSFGDYHNVSVVMQKRICLMCGYIDTRVVRDGKVEDEMDLEIPKRRRNIFGKIVQDPPVGILSFPDGLTVKKLKSIINKWSDKNDRGELTRVWIGSDGLSNEVFELSPLDGPGTCADIILVAYPEKGDPK